MRGALTRRAGGPVIAQAGCRREGRFATKNTKGAKRDVFGAKRE
jgi:hypothetical protein